MPVYEYKCRDCEASFEEMVPAARRDQSPVCPQCSGKKTDRKMSVFAAHSGQSQSASMPMGGCGRCGDPDGPCGR